MKSSWQAGWLTNLHLAAFVLAGHSGVYAVHEFSVGVLRYDLYWRCILLKFPRCGAAVSDGKMAQ